MSVRKRIEQQDFSDTADEAVVSVLVAADYLEQTLGDVISRHGITSEQYNVLRILRGAHPEGHARHEIARRMIRRAPDVTRILDRLARRKLITRTRGTDDARLSIARITQTGLALLRRIDPEVEEMQRSLVSALNAGERRELARLCDRILTDGR
jgi:DNA-binding MarR family transcriptional regulator